ncbi:MAG: ubiquinone biosynthesis regulatory protein kinase UbiB [Legionella sp.]
MKPIKQLLRLLAINHILAKNGLDEVITSLQLFTPLRFLIYLNPWNWFRREKLNRGAAIRKSLEQLGPIFIKFGQALSTRPDILPPDIALELCQLQSNVPPFPTEQALAIIELAFGQPAQEIFAFFDTNVLASASMAQVHAATLKSGKEVVVKILRPNIQKTITNDLAILHSIANLADKYWPDSKRFKPKDIVIEFERSLLDELNLHREAANAGQLRRNFQASPLLYVPEIYWDYVRENILVMERIYGIPVADVRRLQDHGINIKKLAERGIEIFFTQVFRDCFFHADMHPGNIFVSLQHPEDPQYICIDFGIIGTLDDNDKHYLAENLLAFFNRDYRRVAQLHIESGWIDRHTRLGEFESAIRTVCEPIFERPLKDISFALVMMQLFQVARRFRMHVQPQLILLQKTLLSIEGLGRQLYPELDLWATAKPFLEKWVREQMGPTIFVNQLRNNWSFLIQELPHMPKLLHDVLVLHKEQQLQHSAKIEHQPVAVSRWREGFIIGLFLASSFVAISGNYLDLLDTHELGIIARTVALVSGTITVIFRFNRS